MLNTYFKEEIKRAFFSRQNIIAIFLSIALFFIGMIDVFSWIFRGDSSVFFAFLQGYNSGTANFLIILFPIIVCIPFASSFNIDKLTGFKNYLSIRLENKYYKLIRWFVNGVVGGFVLFIGPFLGFVFLLISKLIFDLPIIKEETETFEFFSQLGIQSPVVIICIILINLFVCGFTFATLGLGVSTLINNKYVAMLVPFIFLLVSATILNKMNTYFSAISLYNVHFFGMGFIERLIYFSILLCISTFLFFWGERIREIWER